MIYYASAAKGNVAAWAKSIDPAQVFGRDLTDPSEQAGLALGDIVRLRMTLRG